MYYGGYVKRLAGLFVSLSLLFCERFAMQQFL